MYKKLTAFLLSAILVCTALSGCAPANDISSGAAKDFPVTINNVTIRSEPEGAAVLSPNIASIILAMGYETQLKARSESCTQSDLAVLPVVTMDDADKIKSLGATLAFTDTDMTDEQKTAMAKAGITVLKLSSASGRENLSNLYSLVGAALKGGNTGKEKGNTIAQGILQTIDDITREIPESETPISAVYLSDAEGGAATADTLQGKLVEAAGLVNSASGGTKGKIKLSDLAIADPQYIFCAKGMKEKLESAEETKNLTAIKENKILEMDRNLMTLQGEELVHAVSFMAGTVYPELASSDPSSGSSSSVSSGTTPDNNIDTEQTLKKGMQNDDVLKLQKRLQELGYMFLNPSGLFAEGTEQSVKDFQYLNNLTVTGIADPETLKKIYSSDAKKRTS